MPYTVAVTDGSPALELPPGLRLVQATESTWVIEGVPEVPGEFVLSFTVTNSAENSYAVPEASLSITDGSP